MNPFVTTNKFLSILKLFIIIQPILDILTTLSIYYTDFSITVGIVFRMVFMMIALMYIFFRNDSKLKKYIIWYLIAVFAVLGTGFVANIFFKPVFNLFMELQWITKIVYFIVMLCSITLIFSERENYRASKMKMLYAVFIALSIVVGTILISIITNTSADTYEWVKGGYKGWYYSGNELGAIFAITFPLIYLYSFKKTTSLKDYKYWIPTLALAIIGLLLGTKVGLFSIVGSIVIILITTLLQWVAKIKAEGTKNKHAASLLLSLMLVTILAALSSFTPAVQNLSVDMPVPDEEGIASGFENGWDDNPDDTSQDTNESDSSNMEDETAEETQQDPENTITIDSEILNKILSSRQIYFTWQYNQYIHANVFQKVFGMGYGGNYYNNRKTIEMDFLDVFFSFGILGSLLIFLPSLLLVVYVVKNLFTAIKEVVRIENILLLTSILMGNGIALIAGHVWFSPAVSLYLSISMVLLYYNLRKRTIEKETI